MTGTAVVTASAFQWSDMAIVFATLAGPVLAVQTQKWLERTRSIRERRSTIFRTLMTTRAATLSPVHVEALNSVPVEFYGTKPKLKKINDAWKMLLDHHAPQQLTGEAWMQKRQDLYLDLLHEISQFLGYDFSRSQLANDVYSPQAHGDMETEQTIIRKGFVKLLNGEAVLPMAVREFPATVDEQTFDNQAALTKLLTEWLEGQRAVKVEQPSSDNHKPEA